MNVFGVGPLELVLILVVALVFVGPERLPKLAADIARTIREIRKYTGSLAAEFNEVIQDFEKDTEGERSAWKEIETGITGATKSVTEAVREVRSEVQGAKTDAAAPMTSAAASSLAATPVGESAPPSPAVWTDIPVGPPPAPEDNVPASNGSHASNGKGSGTAPAAAVVPADDAR